MQVQRPSSRGAKCASHSSLDDRVDARAPPSKRYRKRRLSARASISSRRAARRAAVIRGIADTRGRLDLADSVESEQKPTGGGLDQQVAERESPVVASTDFVGPPGFP